MAVKKNFQDIPTQPLSRHAINQYVKSGHGKGNTEGHSEPLKRIIAMVPESLHSQFKSVCAANRTTMHDRILAFVQQEISAARGPSHQG